MRIIHFIADNQNPRRRHLTYQKRIKKLIEKGLIVLVILATVCVSPAFSQQSPPESTGKTPEDVSKDSFLALRDKRDELTKQIDDTGKTLRDLDTSEAWLRDEEYANGILKSNRKITKEERAMWEKKAQDARSFADTPATLEQVRESIKQKQGELDDKRKRRDVIDAEMNRRIDLETPKQKFKTSMSTTFAWLVGLVIVGFFAVAFYDPSVRQEIFSGTSGIQFVTLFSLVIAIILFGITGILEGKELAALLGGLSGYILGRGSAEKPKP